MPMWDCDGNHMKELVNHIDSIVDLYGFSYEDYDYGSEIEQDRHSSWLQFHGVDKNTMESLEADYDLFSERFVEWAKQNDYGFPHIMNDDLESITFEVLM